MSGLVPCSRPGCITCDRPASTAEASLTVLRSIESKLDQVISLLAYPPHVLAEATEAPEPEDDGVLQMNSATGVLEKLMADAQAALFTALLKPKK